MSLNSCLSYQHPAKRINKKTDKSFDLSVSMWALTDSNRRPSACKADALNQLS